MSEGSAVFAMLLGMGLVWGDDMRSINALKGRIFDTESRAAAFLSAQHNRQESRLRTAPEKFVLSFDGHSPVSESPVQRTRNAVSDVRESTYVHGHA